MTMWMPLALWGLHRAMAAGPLRDGLATGVAFALQMLSSLYFGCIFAVSCCRRSRAVDWAALSVAAACRYSRRAPLAGAVIAPIARKYSRTGR